jgi:hypothetical protein
VLHNELSTLQVDLATLAWLRFVERQDYSFRHLLEDLDLIAQGKTPDWKPKA